MSAYSDWEFMLDGDIQEFQQALLAYAALELYVEADGEIHLQRFRRNAQVTQSHMLVAESMPRQKGWAHQQC